MSVFAAAAGPGAAHTESAICVGPGLQAGQSQSPFVSHVTVTLPKQNPRLRLAV